MRKQTLYRLLAIALLLGVFAYNHFLDNKEEKAIIESGKEPKTYTKAYFLPTNTTGQVVHHEGYSLSYSEANEQAEWVAYELKKSQVVSKDYKRPYFEIDKAVKTGAADWKNYKNSGYDRGHLCPAADRAYSETAYNETFLTSNISPQQHDFNSGVWNRLEQEVRYWAEKYNGVFVVTGGVLKEPMERIGFEHVAVPNSFYKIVLDYNNGQAKMIGFLIPHQDSNKALQDFVVSVDSIEVLTGIDFFPALEDGLEQALEASNSYGQWRFN